MVDEYTDADSDVEQSGAAAAGSTTSRDTVTGFNRANQDIGADEAQSRAVVNDSHKWSANDKRTYDAYQDLELSQARMNQEWSQRSRDHYDAMMSDTRGHIANLRKVELELLQNGNTAAKIGDNRMWTMDTEVLEAVAAVVAAKVIDTKDTTTE